MKTQDSLYSELISSVELEVKFT